MRVIVGTAGRYYLLLIWWRVVRYLILEVGGWRMRNDNLPVDCSPDILISLTGREIMSCSIDR